MSRKGADLAYARELYARLMGAASGTDNPRLQRAFEVIPREAFLPPGPWHIFSSGGRRYIETPTADPIHLYQNVLIALDAGKGINNGEPQLHAAWIGAVDPKPGEVVSHVGGGTGYYSALLSHMTSPGGHTIVFERETHLAEAAQRNLEPFEGTSVTCGDATILPLPPSDVIYVNAGVAVPPVQWFNALRPGGRMVFPWRPSEGLGLAMLVRRRQHDLEARSLGAAWFIPCVGASNTEICLKVPDGREARTIRSVWVTSWRPPDASAVAIYPDVWFSSEAVESTSPDQAGD